MPSFNATALNYKVQNGNSVVIMVGEQVIGFGQSSTSGVDFGSDTLYGIGSSLPGEIQQLKLAPSISLSTLMLTTFGLTYIGQPTTWLEVLANTEMDFHIVDGNGDVMLTYKACTCGSYSSDISANQPITEQTQWSALDVLNSAGNSVLASNSAANLNAAGAFATNFLTSNAG